MFVREGDFARPDIGSRYVDRSNNVTIINNSTVIVNTRRDDRRNATYIAGPERDEVQRTTNVAVMPVLIREADRPAQRLSNGELQIYRPLVQKRSGDAQKPAPSRVMRLNEVRPAAERHAGNRQPEVNPDKSAGGNQPSEPRNPPPTQNKGREQEPQKVTPPIPMQPSQPRNVNPSNSRGKEQPQRVTPPNPAQPSQPRNVNPSTSRVKKQEPQKVTPPTTARPQQPRNVGPPSTRGKEQPQKVTPPKKSGESQSPKPKANQEKQDKKKDEEKKDQEK
jgi:hypothetical protein